MLGALLRDERTLNVLVCMLSDQIARSSLLDEALPPELERIASFEDCTWLLTPNLLEHGASRLMVDEAAYLFRLVRSLDRPSVVELGRFHGGTTVLLAAAGARVLSIDVDSGLAAADAALRKALERLGLAESVSVVVADSRSHPLEPDSLDVVFVDADHSYAGATADVDHWWPALRKGGHLILHDGKRPQPARPWNSPWKTEGVRQAADSLRARSDMTELDAPGTLVAFARTG